MKKPMILLAGLSMALTPLQAPLQAMAATPNCVMNKVQNTTGATITLSNGIIYMVYPGRDRVNASLWNPLDKVKVCRGLGGESVITNISQAKPTTISVLQQ
jgi:hypothetical protein